MSCTTLFRIGGASASRQLMPTVLRAKMVCVAHLQALVPATGGTGLDVIVLPGVLFDREGGRLGHGKGYYDRYIRRTRQFAVEHSRAPPVLCTLLLTVGVALRNQLLPAGQSVPKSELDESMHYIVSADGVIST